MKKIKATIKEFFYALGLSSFLDNLLFKISYLKNFRQNKNYAKSHTSIAFPPDYYLYETYQLNYQQYIEDGDLSAKEIIDWTIKYIPKKDIYILEWGCGVSRTVRHIHKFLTNKNAQIFACDINKEMIDWSSKNIKDVSFSLIDYNPPSNYSSFQFDLIYCISVFTHIDAQQQENWVNEVDRILNESGVFLFTTHGSKYFDKLLSNEQKQLNEKGVFTKSYFQKGHRLMSTYNISSDFKKMIEKKFDILEFYEGEKYPEKIGGQDLWIVKKKAKKNF